jgi:hypothetical protein
MQGIGEGMVKEIGKEIKEKTLLFQTFICKIIRKIAVPLTC